jgi:hypothetical protein
MQEDEERRRQKQDFDDRVKAAKRKAIEDNIAKAKASRTNDADHRRAGQSGGCETINYEREVADETRRTRC